MKTLKQEEKKINSTGFIRYNIKKLISILFILFISLALLNTSVLAQSDLLYLQKAGSNTSFYFKPGDILRFTSMDYKMSFSKAQILYFEGDSIIVTDKGEVNKNDLYEVDVRSKVGSYESLLYVAGIGYLGIDLLNQKIQGNPFSLYRGVLLTSGVIIGAGLLIKVLKRKTVILQKRWFPYIRRSPSS